MNHSELLFQRAQTSIPGGVNSPVRAFRGVGGTPIFFKSAKGAYLIDVDDKSYIDYVGSWGPMILGHTHPKVIEAIINTVQHGLSFGAPTEIEIRLAEKICQLMPSIEQVRMVNSGTEATMSAIRLARGYTKRDKIIKFNGCYHGHADFLLVAAGSGGLTFGVPNSAGVPASIAQNTLVAEFNDLHSVETLFKQYGHEIAAVIVEPVAGNVNCIPPVPGFLQGLRALCTQYSSILIIDEVMTGFRVALGGAQSVYGVTPDLTTLGKIIGGGMPVGAFGGRKEIMAHLAPLGEVYQAGTLSGNPVAMTAGLTTLELIEQDRDFYPKLDHATNTLLTGLTDAAQKAQIPLKTTSVGGMFGLFFTNNEDITHYKNIQKEDVERYKRFFHGMLKEGVYFAPSAYEASFMSIAHEEKEIQGTIDAAKKVFTKL